MKFQNPSLNSVLNGRKDERTSRKQYAPHFFKVGGIKMLKHCGRTTDGRRTTKDAGPLVNYKLTYEPSAQVS